MTHFVFDNRFVAQLPGDAEAGSRRREVRGALWSSVLPTPAPAPSLLAYAPEVAAELGFEAAFVQSPGFAQVFGGNALIEGMQPWAANYGGHQFGHWAGQLGDGRALSLGELVGRSGQRHELQLKGAGPTPYSRGADGRAVLRSSIREFVCSEAMHHLGVPTTRALSLVATGAPVMRDMFYDGNAKAEAGAIVCRVAPSFIRFGSFELPAARAEHTLLRQLVEFCIERDYPELAGMADRYARWFEQICQRTALMVAHWMRVGFVHGVMNTDNMSILGLTIDYGPYGWVEAFDRQWTPNTTDAAGRRYRFGAQPQVAFWNLTRLAQALSPLFEQATPLQAGLEAYQQAYASHRARMSAEKLGLADTAAAATLMDELEELMEAGQMDMTLTFRALMALDVDQPRVDVLEAAFYSDAGREAVTAPLQAWVVTYARTVQGQQWTREQRLAAMAQANPVYVPRNWLSQEAIDQAEAGDLTGLIALMDVLRQPYTEQPGRSHYAARRPEWARNRPGCSMLSCSS